jgi:hypothetical protein
LIISLVQAENRVGGEGNGELWGAETSGGPAIKVGN